MEYINCTPHDIVFNDGRVFPKTGQVARVSVTYSAIIGDKSKQIYGGVQGLPAPVAGTKYIVSALVLSATYRSDVVAPATGHPSTVRNDKGHIISVPCFV